VFGLTGPVEGSLASIVFLETGTA